MVHFHELQANQEMERGMLESNLEALRSENASLQQRLEKALQELVKAATPSNPAVLRAFKVSCVHSPVAELFRILINCT